MTGLLVFYNNFISGGHILFARISVLLRPCHTVRSGLHHTGLLFSSDWFRQDRPVFVPGGGGGGGYMTCE